MAHLTSISGGGAFTRQNITDINNNFTAVSEPDIWVRPQYGNDHNVGSYDKPFATMAGCATAIEPGLTIGLLGVLFEEFDAPIVNDVTIVGMGNRPRQATTSGAANGGGATWLSPTSGAASLLGINGQAWKIQNIYFNNTATSATTGCIKITGGGDPPLTADGGHTVIDGCVFTGEANGIYINGGPGFLRITNNVFYFFDTSGDCAILAGGSGGTGYGSYVADNVFAANLTHLKPLATAYGWEITRNRFSYIDAGVTTSVQIDLTGANNNSIHDNAFDVPFNAAGLSAMFKAGTNDRWYANALGTACLTPMTGRVWGIPVSGAA